MLNFLVPTKNSELLDRFGNESAFYQKFIPDDLNDRLSTSRLVNNSAHQDFLDSSMDLGHRKHLCRCRITVDEQLCLLKQDISNCLKGSSLQGDIDTGCNMLQIDRRVDGLKVLLASGFEKMSEMFDSLTALVVEHQLEQELQKEVYSIMIQKYISGLHREFEMKLWGHQNYIGTLNKNWEEKISEVTTLRDELDGIMNAITGSESGMLPSQTSLEGFEEWNFLRRKDDNELLEMEKTMESGEPKFDIPDISLLKHMSSEEITTFLKSEWLKLRRQHELELHEKTEELFRLKREFAKDRALLPLRKEKELEFIKSKLSRAISKLEGKISRKDSCNFNYSDHDELCRMKDRIGSLLHENEHLRGLLADKRKEANHLSSQVLDVVSKIAQLSLSDAKHLNQNKKLRDELEDLKIECWLKDLLHRTILRGILGDCENYIDDVQIQAEAVQEAHSAVVRHVLSDINSTMERHYLEHASLKEMLVQREEQINVMHDDRQKLRCENEQLVSVVGSALMQHHEQVNLVNHELTVFREKVYEQELLILESKNESNSMKSSLYEALQQIHVCKQEIYGLTENLTYMSIALEEAKEQNATLDVTIRGMKKTSAPSINNDKGQAEHLAFVVASMEKLSKSYSDFESKLAQVMHRQEIRLINIICHFNPLVQQVAALKKKEFWYKQTLEIKCSNLQKAEAEVDILGDEVDTLLSVLGKIYVALDHYSPVLRHYPGVMEILKLVKRVLKGESI